MSTLKNKHNCPKGYIMRKGYTRKFRQSIKTSGFTVRRKGTLITVHPKTNTIYVPPGCIKERATAKDKQNENKIRKLRKGALTKYGYQYRLSDHLRHEALKKAIKHYGVHSVYQKLDAVEKLSIHVAPDAHIIFKKDRQCIHDHTMKHK
jgi:hypothetical protein